MSRIQSALTMNVSEEDDEVMIRFGMTDLVKRKHEIPDEMYADVKYIFHTSHLRILDGETKEELRTRPPLLFRERKLTELERKLELPRRLPPIGHDFSNNVLLVLQSILSCSVMVFLVNWCENTGNVSMFHVLTHRFKDMNFGPRVMAYAAIQERLYFVCGSYKQYHDAFLRVLSEFEKLEMEAENPKRSTPNEIRFGSSDSLYQLAARKVKNSKIEHLDVPTYNLRKRAWETKRTPCLIAPKPSPIAFAYDGKLFALTRPHDYKLTGFSPPFEFLDTSCPRPCWTDLPAPPFDMKYYQYYILDEANGIVFLFLEPDLDSCSVEPLYCWQLNLKEKPYVWRKNEYKENNHKSKSSYNRDPIDLGSSVRLGMLNISYEQSRGCIVDDILFSYEYTSKFPKPVICGRYVGCDKSSFEPWVIDGLDEYLKETVDTSLSVGFLNHIGKYRFSLIIKYYAEFTGRTQALYFLIFDLVKEDLPNEFRTIKTRNGSKAQKANKFKFNFKPICDKAFQVPSTFTLQFCKNM